jgi:hypothetical protein
VIDPKAPTAEPVLFASGNVVVTPALIRVGNVTHPLSAVSSIIYTPPPPHRLGSGALRFFSVALLIVGTIVLLSSILLLVAGMASKSTAGELIAVTAPSFIAGTFCVLIALKMRSMAKGNRRPTECGLSIKTGGGDVELIKSRDHHAVAELRATLERAIAGRSP